MSTSVTSHSNLNINIDRLKEIELIVSSISENKEVDTEKLLKLRKEAMELSEGILIYLDSVLELNNE